MFLVDKYLKLDQFWFVPDLKFGYTVRIARVQKLVFMGHTIILGLTLTVPVKAADQVWRVARVRQILVDDFRHLNFAIWTFLA